MGANPPQPDAQRRLSSVGITLLVGLAVLLSLFVTSSAASGSTFFHSSSTATVSGSSSLTILAPAGVVSGDVLLAAVDADVSSGSTIVAPIGWTLLRSDSAVSSSARLTQSVYLRVAGSPEPNAWTWSFTSAANVAGGIVAYSGVDPTSPIDATSGASATGKIKRLTAPSLTAGTAGDLLVALYGSVNKPPQTPSAMTERWRRSVTGASSTLADSILSAAGTVSSPTASLAGQGTSAGIAQLVALRPSASVSSPQPPSSTSPPTISGVATEGQTLTASNGTWSGSPTSYAYGWQRCDTARTNCAAISGAATSVYVLGSGDVNKTIRVQVIASNAGGSSGAASAQIAVVQAAVQTTQSACTLTVTSTSQLLSVNNSSVKPGDVVCISGTLTTSSNIFLSRSGTSSAPIIYRGGTIQYTGGSASGGLLQVGGGTPWAGAHDIVFDGITLDGGNLIGGGIFVSRGGHHVTVENCVIKNTGAVGIAFNATDYVTAVDNLIYRAGYNQGWGSGISLWYGGNGGNVYGGATAWYGDTKSDLGFHNIIARNIVSGTYDNSSNHSDGNGFAVDGSGDIPPALFVGNVALENGGRGFVNLGNSGSVWFVNNTSYLNGLDLTVGSGQAPEIMAQYATNTHWVNNIAYGRKNTAPHTNAYLYNTTSSTISWSRQLAYNGQNAGVPSSVAADANQYRYLDPQFLNRPLLTTGDSAPWSDALAPWNLSDRLTLALASPAIDAGIDPFTAPGMNAALSAGLSRFVDVDLLGHARYNGASIDIGAYES